jgi:geranylgeranyl pyrophosphate synthase
MKRDVLFGQLLDFNITSTTVDDIKKAPYICEENTHAKLTVQLKTASYTSIAPVIFGMILKTNLPFDEIPNHDKIVADALKDGMIFQYENDMDDLENDIAHENISTTILQVLEIIEDTICAESKADKARVLEIVGKGKDITSEDVDELRAIIISYMSDKVY